MKGFSDFIREQGVVGLAVGFILGGAVSAVVSSLVNDIINPLLGLLIGKADLASLIIEAGEAKILLGAFIKVLIDFLIVAVVVYFGVKGLGLDKLDKKEE